MPEPRLWFTSDTHFGHGAILRHCERPFASVEEMDEQLIERWNGVVRPRDVVWHLGDVAWRNPESYLKRLNGQIYLCLGNHDSKRELQPYVNWVGDVKYLRHQGHRFFLSHYPHRRWPNSIHGSFHLYGHVHGDLKGIGKSMDAGVDANRFTPILSDWVIEVLRTRENIDHHGKEDL